MSRGNFGEVSVMEFGPKCVADGGWILDSNPSSVPEDLLVLGVSGNRSSDLSHLCRAGGLVIRALSNQRLQGRLLCRVLERRPCRPYVDIFARCYVPVLETRPKCSDQHQDKDYSCKTKTTATRPRPAKIKTITSRPRLDACIDG